MDPYEIKDSCRNKLTEYLVKALSVIPSVEKPFILDMGCGTGVPTLILAGLFDGTIYAVDSDETALSRLREKIKRMDLSRRVIVCHGSVFEIDYSGPKFDLIIAEGLLNIIGFEKGISLVDKIIKDNGFFIVHDECSNHDEKMEILGRYNYRLVDYFELGEDVWWNDYYRCLEEQISSCDDCHRHELFENELKEIESFKKQPRSFRSIYYIL